MVEEGGRNPAFFLEARMTVPKYDIIIPIYNQGRLTARCLDTIVEHSEDYRLILIDNGSTDDELKYWLYNRLPAVYIRNERNRGFVKAVNQGLKMVIAPFVVIMNNDTEVVEGWLEKLSEPFQYDCSIGAVGPLTTTPNSWQGRTEPADEWGVLPDGSMVAFFCTMFRRDAISQVGLLDESFGIGLGDDDEYCWRLWQNGWKVALTGKLTIPHKHRTTFKALYTDDQIKDMQTKALKRFEEVKNGSCGTKTSC
jgi:O-antigen biosynthesis protein